MNRPRANKFLEQNEILHTELIKVNGEKIDLRIILDQYADSCILESTYADHNAPQVRATMLDGTVFKKIGRAHV